MPMFLCDMRVQSGEASCLERGELALTFHDFKEVGGKENWENPASLMGWTEIYTKGSQVFCHIAGKRWMGSELDLGATVATPDGSLLCPQPKVLLRVPLFHTRHNGKKSEIPVSQGSCWGAAWGAAGGGGGPGLVVCADFIF